jgi:hypothetical protein
MDVDFYRSLSNIMFVAVVRSNTFGSSYLTKEDLMKGTGKLWVSLMAIVTLCLMCVKFSYADNITPTVVASPEVTVTTTVNTVEGPVVVTPEKNPFKIIASEIISFSINGNVGVSGYISNKTNEFRPTLSVQIGTSRHGWINYGLVTNISTEDGQDNLNGLGYYGGLNMIKVVEKVIKKPISKQAGCTLGWTEMYYFTSTDVISKGWDNGLFGAVAVVKF